MKYCTHCGKELLDEAVVCIGCGCQSDSLDKGIFHYQNSNYTALINTLSQRINTSGIIWLVIGILQILVGLYINWVMIIVGVLNVISSIQDMNYSKSVLKNPTGIIAKFEPITGPVITLIYNLIIGGVIGVVGSIYYFIAIRNYVMENKPYFAVLDAEQ